MMLIVINVDVSRIFGRIDIVLSCRKETAATISGAVIRWCIVHVTIDYTHYWCDRMFPHCLHGTLSEMNG